MNHAPARYLLAIALLSLASPARAASATVGVLPVKGTNLSTGEEDAIGALFADAYAAEIGAPVLSPMQLSPELDAAASAETAASRLGLSELIDITIVRLESKLSVRARRTTPDGTLIHSVKLTATGLDDMDQAATRACRALARQTDIESTMTLQTVTRTESRVPNRTFSEKVMGLKTQFVVPVSSGQKYDTMMSLQFDGRLEGTNYFLEFGVGLLLPTGATDNPDARYGGLIAEMGGSWYLYNESISPYVGAGVAPRLLFTSDDAGPRLAVYGQTGLMFMRQSSSRLYVDLRVAQNVIPVEIGGDYDFVTDTRTKSKDAFPTELTLAVGIGW